MPVPEGFVLENQPLAGAVPEGFVLEGQQLKGAVPEGFVLENQSPAMLPSHTSKAIAPEFQGSPDPSRNMDVMGISSGDSPFDSDKTEALSQVGKDIVGVTTKAGAGIVNDLTLGVVNPEKGTVGIPFTDKQYPVAPPLGQSLQDVVGTSPEIAENPYIGMGPGVAGLALPWGVTSKGLSFLTHVVRGAVTGKKLSQTIPAASTAVDLALKVGGRVAHQAATGATIGAAQVLEPKDSRTHNVAITALMGAGGQLVAEGIGAIAKAVGAAKQSAYQQFVDDLGKWAYGEKQFTTPEAAQGWAAQTVTEIVQDAGGLGKVTIKQARRAGKAVRDATKQAEPLDVTPKPIVREGALPKNGLEVKYGSPTSEPLPANVSRPPESINIGSNGHLDKFITPPPANIPAPTESLPLNNQSEQTVEPVKDVLTKEPINSPAIVVPPKEEIIVEPIKVRKRGGQEIRDLSLTPSQRRTLGLVREEVSAGTMEKQPVAFHEQTREAIAWREFSTFPDYFRNKGYTKADTLKAIDATLNNQGVTAKQQGIVEDLNGSKRRQELEQLFSQRKQAFEVRAAEYAAVEPTEVIDALTDIHSTVAEEDYAVLAQRIKEVELEINSAVERANPGKDQAPVAEGSVNSSTDIEGVSTGSRFEVTDTGEQQGVLLAGQREVGRGIKRKQNATVEDMTLFSEPKERAAEKAQGGFNYSGTNADTGGYDLSRKSVIELPEIVEIAKELSKGKYPGIMKKLRARGALGLFRHDDTNAQGKIELLADIFKTPGLAERVLAHEIGHWIDWVPDHTIKRGNLLGHVASLKRYMKTLLGEYEGAPTILTKKDRVRLRREAEKELKANERPDEDIIETITREVPRWKYTGIDVEMIKAIWNDVGARDEFPKLYRALAEMSGPEKKAVIVKAMAGLVDERLLHFGERVKVGVDIVTEQVKRTIPGVTATPEAIAKRYRELLEEEIKKRNQYKLEVISQELKDLTIHWKPFVVGQNQFTKYRFSSPELYADAISALVNEPSLLRKIAPVFEKAFFSYLHRKPEVRDIYYKIQQRYKNREDVVDNRIDQDYEMLRRGADARKSANKQKEAARNVDSPITTILKKLVDKEHATNEVFRKLIKDGGLSGKHAEQTRDLFEQIAYLGSEYDALSYDISKALPEGFAKNPASIDDIGLLGLYKRIAGDRGELANPRGMTNDDVLERTDRLKERLGDKKFNEAVKFLEDYRSIRKQHVIPRLIEGGVMTPELRAKVEDFEEYLKLNVYEHFKKQYGASATAKFHFQTGTLNEVENPIIATILQDFVFLRMAHINKVKASLKIDLEELGGITPAEMKYSQDLKRMTPVEPKEPDLELFPIIYKGKAEWFYVDKAIAKSFQRDPVEASHLGTVLGYINQIQKGVLVRYNPKWVLRNMPRDIMQTIANNQEVGISDIPRLLWAYITTAKDVWNAAIKGHRSEQIQNMLREKRLDYDRPWRLKDEDIHDEMEKIAAKFIAGMDDIVLDRNKNNTYVSSKTRRILRTLGRKFDNFGQFTEWWSKVAGEKYLSPKIDKAALGHRIRDRVGTPNYYKQGEWDKVLNNVFIFSRVNMGGLRAAIEAAKQSPGNFWWKKAVFAASFLTPMALAAYNTDFKKWWDKVPRFYRYGSNIIPLGIDENGKSAFIALPKSYDDQVIGGVLGALWEGKFTGKDGALAAIKSGSPYNLNPIYDSLLNLSAYYLAGMNPVDSFRSENILTDQQTEAGGWETGKALLRHAYGNMGGGVSTMLPWKNSDVVKKTRGEWEEMLQAPILNVFPGTFLKISDGGEREELSQITGEIRAEAAIKAIKVKRSIVKHINDNDGATASSILKLARQLKKDGLIDRSIKFKQFRAKYRRYQVRTQNSVKIDAIIFARGNKEKAALLQHYKDSLSHDQYRKIKRQLIIEGYVKRGALREMILSKQAEE